MPFLLPLVKVKGAPCLDSEARVAGKNHDRCCQGFSASSASQRRTVHAEGTGAHGHIDDMHRAGLS